MDDRRDGGKLESADRSAIRTLKARRAMVKRRITNTLKKIHGTIEQESNYSWLGTCEKLAGGRELENRGGSQEFKPP